MKRTKLLHRRIAYLKTNGFKAYNLHNNCIDLILNLSLPQKTDKELSRCLENVSRERERKKVRNHLDRSLPSIKF